MQNYVLEQWRLHTAYATLREKADHYGILLIGDAPFYLSHRSPLVWAYQHLFTIGADGTLPRVSGVPYQPRELYGRQVWGHPLYRFEDASLHPQILSLWKHRLHYLEQLHDIVRLDHAVGFFHYGSLDPLNQDNDESLPGPGKQFFEEIITFCRQSGLHVYAEEAAIELGDLRKALAALGVPGIRVLRFALNTTSNTIQKDYADPIHYPVSSFAYTTVHDTETLMGFLQRLATEQKQILSETTHISYSPDDKTMAERLRQTIINSPSEMIIIQLQDWVLTADRINVPGTENEADDPNWQYRLHIPIEQLPTELF
jgi:4-alpha-glucanotransferase